MADQAAGNLRITFNPDPAGKMDSVSFARLEDPIKAVQALAHSIDPTGGAGKNFCSVAGPVLAKFPFSPKSSTEASPEDVAQIFSPVQGELDKLYSKIGSSLVYQGGQYVAAPGTQINSSFVSFFNAAKKVSNALFPRGGTQPSLTFTLTEVKTPGVPDAILNIDGQQLTSAGQKTTFSWVSSASSRITLQGDPEPMTGPWSVFRLGFLATHSKPNELDYAFSFQGHTNQVLRFEADGLGAPLLNPGFMNQLRCVPTIVKP